jgi:hypothetical protein
MIIPAAAILALSRSKSSSDWSSKRQAACVSWPRKRAGWREGALLHDFSPGTSGRHLGEAPRGGGTSGGNPDAKRRRCSDFGHPECPPQRTSSPHGLEKCPIIEQNMAWKLGIYFFTVMIPISRLEIGIRPTRKFFPSPGLRDGVVREFFPGREISVRRVVKLFPSPEIWVAGDATPLSSRERRSAGGATRLSSLEGEASGVRRLFRGSASGASGVRRLFRGSASGASGCDGSFEARRRERPGWDGSFEARRREPREWDGSFEARHSDSMRGGVASVSSPRAAGNRREECEGLC